jgi:hypothetical protein
MRLLFSNPLQSQLANRNGLQWGYASSCTWTVASVPEPVPPQTK